MAAGDRPDYHALDRLYSLQSEERQERRGLETRAGASIAAALTAVAFSANAVSDRLPDAKALAVVFLAAGGALVFVGVFLSTFALLGGSSTTIAIARRLGGELARVNVAIGPFAITLDSELNRASVDVDDAARALLVRLRVKPTPAGADANRLASTLTEAAKVLRRLSGTQWAATSEIGESTSRVEEVTTEAAGTAAHPTDQTSPGLREPADLDLALEVAEAAARRLRQDNAASVIVLKASSFLISLGVLVTVVGVILTLARPVATDGATARSNTPATATTP
jgi:hypothetical protein